jgi:hypothetical protein
MCVLCTKLPCSWRLLRVCNAYTDTGWFDFTYRMYIWCLTDIVLSVCPTYDLLQVLRSTLYITLEIALLFGNVL